jgi:hypothetical protein
MIQLDATQPIKITAKGKDSEGNKWYTDPLSMCVADVERRGARLGWPEIVNGLYTPDEIEIGLNERGIELLEAAA